MRDSTRVWRNVLLFDWLIFSILGFSWHMNYIATDYFAYRTSGHVFIGDPSHHQLPNITVCIPIHMMMKNEIDNSSLDGQSVYGSYHSPPEILSMLTIPMTDDVDVRAIYFDQEDDTPKRRKSRKIPKWKEATSEQPFLWNDMKCSSYLPSQQYMPTKARVSESFRIRFLGLQSFNSSNINEDDDGKWSGCSFRRCAAVFVSADGSLVGSRESGHPAYVPLTGESSSQYHVVRYFLLESLLNPPPNSRCRFYASSRSHCLNECRNRVSVNRTGRYLVDGVFTMKDSIATIRLPSLSPNQAGIREEEEESEVMDFCEDQCRPGCSIGSTILTHTSHPKPTKRNIGMNETHMGIQFPPNCKIIVLHTQDMTLFRFITETGKTLSLWFGFTIFAFPLHVHRFVKKMMAKKTKVASQTTR